MKNKIEGCGKQCLVDGLDRHLQCGEMDGKNQFLCHECNKEYFTLSKKIAKTNFSTITDFIRVKDVKEFIKKLKKKLCICMPEKVCNECSCCYEINELAGKNLI